MSAPDRNRKLAEAAEVTFGVLHGIAAFDDRLEEMGPGPAARGNGHGGKGGSSSPVEGQLLKPARVVTSNMDRLVDRLHAAALDVDAAYGEIARTQRGLPAKGEPSCAWCDESVQAAAKVAATALAKARAKGDETVELADLSPVPLDYRSPTYLYAEVKRGEKVVARNLVCLWCYRFNLRFERKPTIEERWVHAQGGRVLVKMTRDPGDRRVRRAKAVDAG